MFGFNDLNDKKVLVRYNEFKLAKSLYQDTLESEVVKALSLKRGLKNEKYLLSYKDIANIFSVSESTISRIAKKYNLTRKVKQESKRELKYKCFINEDSCEDIEFWNVDFPDLPNCSIEIAKNENLVKLAEEKLKKSLIEFEERNGYLPLPSKITDKDFNDNKLVQLIQITL